MPEAMHTWKAFHLDGPLLPESTVPRENPVSLNWVPALRWVAGG